MALRVGATAPDFDLADQDNERVSLAGLKGKKVVLIFFPFAFSATCTKEFHDVKTFASRIDAEGAQVLGLSVDSRHSLRAWKESNGYTATFLADFEPKGEVARAYDAYHPAGFAKRTTYVVDGEGKIAHVIDQEINEKPDPEEYLAALAACPV